MLVDQYVETLAASLLERALWLVEDSTVLGVALEGRSLQS